MGLAKVPFWLACVVFLVVISCNMALDSECRLCRISRVHRMKAVDCYKRELHVFPKCLPTDAEILELSVNRIRKISRDDLSSFKYLKILYLKENVLVKINEEVFEDMDDLATLDISSNAITKLPSRIFQLPSLKSLYLSQNWNINIVDAVEGSKPISSPITQMDISFTTDDDYIPELPDFGPMPYLASLNITGNKYSLINPKTFFGMCKLQYLASGNVTAEYDDPCDCWVINNWLMERGVIFTTFSCHVPKLHCANINYKPEHLALHNECKRIILDMEVKNKIYKISVGVGSCLVILLIIVLGFVIYKKRKSNKKAEEKKKKNYQPPDNLELLNNRNKTVPNEYQL